LIPLPDLLFFNSEEQVSQQHIAMLIQKGILFFGISLKGSVLGSLFFSDGCSLYYYMLRSSV